MILEDLMSFIEKTNSPERVSAYKGLLPFLMQLDPSLMEMNLSQFVGFMDDYDTINNREQLDNFLIQVVSEGIEDFGIYLSESADYRDSVFLLGDTLRALYRVDQYEDMAALTSILEDGVNAKETVVEILSAVSPELDVSALLNYIDEVSSSLVRRWKDSFADLSYQFDDQLPAAEPLLVERVRLALQDLQIESARNYFTEGGVIGEPIDNYLDYYLGYLKPKDDVIRAKFALFSAIAADAAADEIRSIAGAKMEYYYSGAELLNVTRKISTLPLPEFVYAQA
ncbi:hypothetical protein TOTORO_03030 [Serratia phage vB_SmaS-Totoro]|nr:hypothetical protein TOTORO_03030 [Serratia phage vB_SmaS-Totoro]